MVRIRGRSRSSSANSMLEMAGEKATTTTMSSSDRIFSSLDISYSCNLTQQQRRQRLASTWIEAEESRFETSLLRSCARRESLLALAEQALREIAMVDLVGGCGEESRGLVERLLCVSDRESGYTPLHHAVMEGSLGTVLLLLQASSWSSHSTLIPSSPNIDKGGVCMREGGTDVVLPHRFVQRPMAMLQGMGMAASAKAAGGTCTTQMVGIRDREGLTALDLMCLLGRKELCRCREALRESWSVSGSRPSFYDGQSRRKGRDYRLKFMTPNNYNEDEDDDDDEDSVADQNSFLPLGSTTSWSTSTNAFGKNSGLKEDAKRDFGCEVVTFGRTDHCALGTTATSTTSTTRPQRVREFGLDEVLPQGSAVAVAAAAHHTLVLTRNGRVYATGLGRGGRLGTGDELPRPLPTEMLFPVTETIVGVAAAENHSLCVTREGAVYACGSNRFGQLGFGRGQNTRSQGKNGSGGIGVVDSRSGCLLPRKVDSLKHVRVVAVAAGDRHSVALTADGEVYCWGDNRSGQLGTSPIHNSSSSSSNQIGRVLGGLADKVVVAVAASECSTLVLVRNKTTLSQSSSFSSSKSSSHARHAVYWWGHGNHIPTRVHFQESRNNSADGKAAVQVDYFDPVMVACARHHNVAVTAEGEVFCWGFHSDALGGGGGQGKQASSTVCTVPQRVMALSPRQTKSRAVAVSASDDHTAVLTEDGHLYTWGAVNSLSKQVLGHDGLRWQPLPKRVPGVYRAVAVAAGREHTVLLVGTSFPSPLPTHDVHGGIPSLATLAARAASRHVDLFNAVPVLAVAERHSDHILTRYCREFIRCNFDAVLNLGRKSEMGAYLDDRVADGLERLPRDDGAFHPAVLDLTNTVERCGGNYQDEAHAVGAGGVYRIRASSIDQGWSTVVTPEVVRVRYDGIVRELRGIRKRLHQIDRMTTTTVINLVTEDSAATSSTSAHSAQIQTSMSEEQRRKLARRPGLEANRDLLERELEEVEKQMRRLGIHPQQLEEQAQQQQPERRKKQVQFLEPVQVQVEVHTTIEDVGKTHDENKGGEGKLSFLSTTSQLNGSIGDSTTNPAVDTDAPKDALAPTYPLSDTKKTFHCALCGVACPDATSYELHLNGRRHANRAQRENESKGRLLSAVAAAEEKERGKTFPATVSSPAAPTAHDSYLPAYKLPPPPHFPGGIGPAKTSAPAFTSVVTAPVAAAPTFKGWNLSPPPSVFTSATTDFRKIIEGEAAAKHAKVRKTNAVKGHMKKVASPSTPRPTTIVSTPEVPRGVGGNSSSGVINNEGSKGKKLSPKTVGWNVSTHIPSATKNSDGSKTVVPSLRGILMDEDRQKKQWESPVTSVSTIPVVAPIATGVSTSGTMAKEQSLSLGDFITKKEAFTTPTPKPRAAPTWSSPTTSSPVISTPSQCLYDALAHSMTPEMKAKVTTTATTMTKSFLEIQKEEEDFKKRAAITGVEDMAGESCWYIERRERASSIAAIQEQEEEEESERQFLEEARKQIEELESREREEEELRRKRRQQRQRKTSRRHDHPQSSKKDLVGGGKEGRSSRRRGGGKGRGKGSGGSDTPNQHSGGSTNNTATPSAHTAAVPLAA